MSEVNRHKELVILLYIYFIACLFKVRNVYIYLAGIATDLFLQENILQGEGYFQEKVGKKLQLSTGSKTTEYLLIP